MVYVLFNISHNMLINANAIKNVHFILNVLFVVLTKYIYTSIMVILKRVSVVTQYILC